MLTAPPVRGGVLVAASGGADSTALAVLLADAGVGPVHLAHVRHGFRLAAAAAELDVVAQLAERLGVPLHVVELSPPRGFAPGAKIPEAWAREQRYASLAGLARRLGIPTLATGHHARDRRETQLLHLLRGGRLRALAGMSAQRSLDGIRLWRPLLDREPEELRALLRERGIAWGEDPSNLDLRLARNRVRHLLVPELERRGDPLLARADRLAALAARVLARLAHGCDRLLDRAAASADGRRLVLPIDEARALPPSVLRELLERAAARVLRGGRLRARRRELEPLITWLRDPRSRGVRRAGALAVERSAAAVTFFAG